jgi:hypothetical protein
MELVQWREKSTSLKETYVSQFESHIEDWAA